MLPSKTPRLDYLPRHHPMRVHPLPPFPRVLEVEEAEKRSGEEAPSTVHMTRHLNFVNVTNFILNVVIGSGIFVTPGTIIRECGSVGMSLVIWSVTACIALLTALPFVELCSVVPRSGSLYIYLQEAFADSHPFWGQVPAFVYIWLSFLFMYPLTLAVRMLVTTEYIYASFIQVISPETDKLYGNLIKNVFGSFVLIMIGVINAYSVKIYIIMQDVLTYFKVTLCLILILTGAYMVLSEQAPHNDFGFTNTTLSPSGLPLVLVYGYFSFEGAVMVTGLTEEIKNPESTIQKSMMIALGVITALYLLLVMSFFCVLSKEELLSGIPVAKLFAEKVISVKAGLIVSVCVAIGGGGTNLSGIFFSSRLGLAAAREGHLNELFSYIHRTRLTPVPGLIAQVLCSLVFFIFNKNTGRLITDYSFILWFYNGLSMLALFVLRKKKPYAYRPYKVPLVIPGIVMAFSWLIVLWYVATQPVTTFVWGIILIFLGVGVLYLFVHKKTRVPGVDKVTKRLQKWLDVVPAS